MTELKEPIPAPQPTAEQRLQLAREFEVAVAAYLETKDAVGALKAELKPFERQMERAKGRLVELADNYGLTEGHGVRVKKISPKCRAITDWEAIARHCFETMWALNDLLEEKNRFELERMDELVGDYVIVKGGTPYYRVFED